MDGQTIININGKSVGVKFNLYGLQEMDKVKGNNSSFQYLVSLIWVGILGYAFSKQTEPEVNFEEVVDWLDAVQLTGDKDGEIKKVNTAFETSQVYDKLVKPAIEKQDTSETKKEDFAKIRQLFTGELGYTPYTFFNLLPRELNDIVEGYNNKLKRETDLVIYQTRVQRKSAFISILPHIKPGSITEERFNREVWPIDEGNESTEEKQAVVDKEKGTDRTDAGIR